MGSHQLGVSTTFGHSHHGCPGATSSAPIARLCWSRRSEKLLQSQSVSSGSWWPSSLQLLSRSSSSLPLLPGCAATTHIDNMSALLALVEGGPAAWDLSHLATVAHVALAVLDATAWWEWVPSASNADGGSRAGVTDASLINSECRLWKWSSLRSSRNFRQGATELVQLLVDRFCESSSNW